MLINAKLTFLALAGAAAADFRLGGYSGAQETGYVGNAGFDAINGGLYQHGAGKVDCSRATMVQAAPGSGSNGDGFFNACGTYLQSLKTCPPGFQLRGECGSHGQDSLKDGAWYADIIDVTENNKKYGTCYYENGGDAYCPNEDGGIEYGLSIGCYTDYCGGK